MRPRAFQLSLLGFVAFAALSGACGEEKICSRNLRLAVRVHVTSPAGLPIDRVTAEQSHEIECGFSSSPDDAGSDRMYRCHEQGGGLYTVRVYSGDAVWTSAVHVDANECHTTEIKDVDVTLDPNHAGQDDDQDDEDHEDDKDGDLDSDERGDDGQAGHGR
jgi:hypothetical protein